MANFKCIDCGQEHDSRFEACPNCGCPSEYKKTHRKENLSQQKGGLSKKKKIIFLVLSIIFARIAAIVIFNHFELPYKLKMARFEKKARKYKASLAKNNQVIGERIDSIAQKVYYFIPNDEGYGNNPIKTIEIHDYATNETKSILPEFRENGDYEFCNNECEIEYINSKLIEDRLFIVISCGCWEENAIGVFYVDVRDNTLHYVETCNNVEFDDSNRLIIQTVYYFGDDEEGAPNYEFNNYSLPTNLSDKAYAEKRQEQKEMGERLAEEWRRNEEIRKRNEVKAWLVGTWESSGWDEWIGRYTSYVCITENTLRFGYNGQDIYNGRYEIDMESHNIIFDRHDGYYTRIGFNPRTQRLEDETGTFRKVSNNAGYSSSNSSSYGSRSGNNYSTVSFRTDTDVISYTSSHTFRNNRGNSVKINFQGMYLNGNLVTNAPRVLYFSGSSATISVSSPYTGGGAMIIKVDASRGTITDGSGDVFRMVN